MLVLQSVDVLPLSGAEENLVLTFFVLLRQAKSSFLASNDNSGSRHMPFWESNKTEVVANLPSTSGVKSISLKLLTAFVPSVSVI